MVNEDTMMGLDLPILKQPEVPPKNAKILNSKHYKEPLYLYLKVMRIMMFQLSGKTTLGSLDPNHLNRSQKLYVEPQLVRSETT